MNSLDYVVNKVLEVIRRDIRKNASDSYDTGTVKRIDGNIAWVQYDEKNPQVTPVVISGASCKKGDKVRIKNNNGTAFILGNDSNPPTDDTKAEHAQVIAEISGQTAEEAQTTASEAEQEATIASQTAEAADTKADTALEQVGASITTDTLHYLATDLDSGVTTSTPGWTTTVQSITSALPYLWTYHTYHKASGQSVNTQPVITGVYGDTGAAGPQGPAGQQGEQGPAGSDGDDGISVTAVQPQYYLSTSSSSATGGSWGNSLNYETGKYIWTRDQITYSNSTTGYSTAIYNEALTTACSTSEQALNVAEGVDEHFWYDNTGAHVTEDTQEDYQQDPENAGGNTLITSQGMAIRKGTKELATMTKDGFDAKTYDSSDNEVVIAYLGYGEGTDSGGSLSKAPYYDIGHRLSGSTKGNYSTAEGYNTTASGYVSHAEGQRTEATGAHAHAEGLYTEAAGNRAHAEGEDTIASGNRAHAEGYYTTASGNYSHSQNYHTEAGYDYQTAIGKYNDNKSADLFEVGNGTSSNERSNAFEVSDTGDVKAAGELTASNIGAKNWVAPSSVSCQTGKWYKVAEVTLDPGIWFIDCNAHFPKTNTTGARQIRVTTETFTNGTTTAPASYGNIANDIIAGANTAQYPQAHFPVDISSQTTFRLAAYQDSKSTMSVTGRMYATRIK